MMEWNLQPKYSIQSPVNVHMLALDQFVARLWRLKKRLQRHEVNSSDSPQAPSALAFDSRDELLRWTLPPLNNVQSLGFCSPR